MRGTAGWMFTTWLSLVALQALSSRAAPGRVGQLFKDADALLARVLDPTVPAIPDLAAAKAAAAGAPPAPSSTTGAPSDPTTTTPRLPLFAGSARAV